MELDQGNILELLREVSDAAGAEAWASLAFSDEDTWDPGRTPMHQLCANAAMPSGIILAGAVSS